MGKKKILVSMLIAAGVVTSPMSHATTNGDEMMAVGTENMALGGTGVAHYVGAESVFANPAMLGKSTGSEVDFGLDLFKPDVTNNGMPTGASPTTAATSSANSFIIPDISYSSRINDTLTYGVAMAGIAGMGVDYSGASSTTTTYAAAKTSLSILRVIPTIAYNKDNYGLGFSPVLQYGSLAISYATQAGPYNANNNANSATGLGFNLGGYYNVSPALTVAAEYSSKISISYGNQLSKAGAGFGQTFSDELDQPAQMKAGVAYNITNNFLVTADYKQIQWSSADGYKQFGWKDENVIAIGGKYSGNGYWVGLGYNNANNPIGTFANGQLTTGNGTNGQNGIGNLFNNLMFPAIVQNSYTLGGGYDLSKGFELDGAYVMSPKVTTTVDISDAGSNPHAAPPVFLPAGSLYNTTTHSQQSFCVSLRYKF